MEQDTKEIAIEAIAAKLKGRIEELQTKLAERESQLRERALQVKRVERQLDLAESRLGQIEKERDQMIAQVAELEVELEGDFKPDEAAASVELATARQEIRHLKRQLDENAAGAPGGDAELQSRVSDLTEEIDELKATLLKLEPFEDMVEDQRKEIAALKSDLGASDDQIAELEAKLQSAGDVDTTASAELEKRIEELETQLQEAAKENETRQKQHEGALASLAEAEDKARELETGGEQVDEIQAKLEDALTKLEETHTRLEETEAKLEATEKELEETQQELEEARAAVEETKSELETAHEQREEAVDELKAAEKNLEESQGQAASLEELIVKANDELEATKSALAEAEQKIDESGSQEEELERLRQELEDSNKELERAKKREESLRELLDAVGSEEVPIELEDEEDVHATRLVPEVDRSAERENSDLMAILGGEGTIEPDGEEWGHDGDDIEPPQRRHSDRRDSGSHPAMSDTGSMRDSGSYASSRPADTGATIRLSNSGSQAKVSRTDDSGTSGKRKTSTGKIRTQDKEPVSEAGTVGPEEIGVGEFERRIREDTIVKTKRFGSIDLVNRLDIQVSDWLQQSDSWDGLQEVSGGRMAEAKLIEVLYLFFKRKLIRLKA